MISRGWSNDAVLAFPHVPWRICFFGGAPPFAGSVLGCQLRVEGLVFGHTQFLVVMSSAEVVSGVDCLGTSNLVLMGFSSSGFISCVCHGHGGTILCMRFWHCHDGECLPVPALGHGSVVTDCESVLTLF